MTAVIDLAPNGYIVVTIFLSIVGTLAGILGFVGSNDAMVKQRKGNWLRACLYWVSMLPSVCCRSHVFHRYGLALLRAIRRI